jgi:3-hydroxyisobutyrate dehydrogenase
MSDDRTIAVLGAGGIMGRPMAANLVKAGFAVRGWNRTRDKAVQDGVDVAGSPAEAAGGAPIVLTMLADADAVLEAMAEVPAGDFLWLQMSTIGIEGTERAKALAGERGATFVDAPVLGTKGPAEAGELIVIASGAGGDEVTRAAAQSVFDAVGKRTVWAGEAGAATKLKLVANAWILSLVEATGETFALAEGLGVDPSSFLDVVSGGAMDVPYLQMKGKAIMARDFDPAFRLELAAKDAGLVADAAAAAGLDLPLVETIRDRMREGIGEHGDKDMIATYLTSALGA